MVRLPAAVDALSSEWFIAWVAVFVGQLVAMSGLDSGSVVGGVSHH